MSWLIFNLKEKYFNQIKEGTKDHEYREIKPYWIKRLKKKPFSGIQIRLGYPKSTDSDKIMYFPWRGYFETTVDLMGEGEKKVFAFPLDDSVEVYKGAFG